MAPFGDFIQPFQIEAPGVRGRLVRLGPALASALKGHGYPPPAARLLAEAVALAAVLASGLKYDGVFTLQIQGDGPISLMVADVTSDGALRGYARVDAARFDDSGGGDAPVPRLLGAGHLAFTVDQGPNTERYQGITPLEGASLTDCAHTYFRQSEQLQTAIVLSATDLRGEAPRAAALMIQRLPTSLRIDPESDDDWRRAVILTSSVTPAELLDPALSVDAVLYRLFHEDGVRVFQRRSLLHRCRCSRERVSRTLASFPREEVAAMADDDGLIRVTCEFCRAEYVFDDVALASLY